MLDLHIVMRSRVYVISFRAKMYSKSLIVIHFNNFTWLIPEEIPLLVLSEVALFDVRVIMAELTKLLQASPFLERLELVDCVVSYLVISIPSLKWFRMVSY